MQGAQRLTMPYYDVITIKHCGAYGIAESIETAESAQFARLSLISYQTDDLHRKMSKSDGNSPKGVVF